jgi:hypothetical protein
MTWTPEQFWEYVGGLVSNWERDQMRNMLTSKGLTIVQAQSAWRPIESAPTDPDATFMVCAIGDKRGPFVVSGNILWMARKAGTPSHLGLSYVTHWMPLPAPPSVVTRPK